MSPTAVAGAVGVVSLVQRVVSKARRENSRVMEGAAIGNWQFEFLICLKRLYMSVAPLFF